MIGVKNNTAEKFVGRYDGEDFVFEPGVPLAITPDAAAHIFGFGLEDKKPVLQRLGWMRTLDNMDEALAKLAKFQFLAVESRFEEPKKIPTDLTKPMADPESGKEKVSVTDEVPKFVKK